MALRFGNGIFEPLWNRDHIDSVQITASETVGVEKRGKFYEITGALRDMVPNHMFQLLAMTTMEPPNSFDADAVRSEKAKVIEAIHPMTAADVEHECRSRPVRRRAHEPEGDVPSYTDEPDVAKDSTVETFIRDQADDRQLALGWRAVLPAHRQAHVHAHDRNCAITFKQAPFDDVPRYRRWTSDAAERRWCCICSRMRGSPSISAPSSRARMSSS